MSKLIFAFEDIVDGRIAVCIMSLEAWKETGMLTDGFNESEQVIANRAITGLNLQEITESSFDVATSKSKDEISRELLSFGIEFNQGLQDWINKGKL